MTKQRGGRESFCSRCYSVHKHWNHFNDFFRVSASKTCPLCWKWKWFPSFILGTKMVFFLNAQNPKPSPPLSFFFCITALPNTPFPSAPVSLRANICMPLCSDGLLENKAEDRASFWKLQGAMPLSLSSYDPGLQRSGVWPEHVGYFHVAQMSLAGGPIWGTTALGNLHECVCPSA